MRTNLKLHWSQINERGGLLGLKILLACYRIFGKGLTLALLYPILFYYYLFFRTARLASHQYLSYWAETFNLSKLNSFKHFMSFGSMLVDKLAVWNNHIGLDQIDFPNKQYFLDSIQQGKGGVIFTAHLGNIEIARALSHLVPGVKVTALTFTQHAKNFNTILAKVNPRFNFNMLQLKDINIAFAMQLQEKIERGEFIVMAADRTSVSKAVRSIEVNFLSHIAYLPEGVFILAGLLKCPAYFMVCMKESTNRFTIFFEHFADSLSISKANRIENLNKYGNLYIKQLQEICCRYPLQWFNFFDFWANKNE